MEYRIRVSVCIVCCWRCHVCAGVWGTWMAVLWNVPAVHTWGLCWCWLCAMCWPILFSCGSRCCCHYWFLVEWWCVMQCTWLTQLQGCTSVVKSIRLLNGYCWLIIFQTFFSSKILLPFHYSITLNVAWFSECWFVCFITTAVSLPPLTRLSARRAVQGQRHGIAGVQRRRVQCGPQCGDLENQKTYQELGDGQRVRLLGVVCCMQLCISTSDDQSVCLTRTLAYLLACKAGALWCIDMMCFEGNLIKGSEMKFFL